MRSMTRQRARRFFRLRCLREKVLTAHVACFPWLAHFEKWGSRLEDGCFDWLRGPLAQAVPVALSMGTNRRRARLHELVHQALVSKGVRTWSLEFWSSQKRRE